jgi:hypothetical protein
MIQGGSIFMICRVSRRGKGRYFTGGYRRVVLEGVGHFPHREAADDVTEAVLHLEEHGIK